MATAEIHSTAEVGVMQRHMADGYADLVGDGYTRQLTEKLQAALSGFEPTGDDQADGRKLSESLAGVLDDLDLSKAEDGMAQALFQAGAIGMSSTPLVEGDDE